MYTNSLQDFANLPNREVPSEICTCIAELELEVHRWMATFHAWDERKHRAIVQFLSDIKGHCSELHSPGSITLSVIMMELDRLSKKLADKRVSLRVDELKKVLHASVI